MQNNHRETFRNNSRSVVKYRNIVSEKHLLKNPVQVFRLLAFNIAKNEFTHRNYPSTSGANFRGAV